MNTYQKEYERYYYSLLNNTRGNGGRRSKSQGEKKHKKKFKRLEKFINQLIVTMILIGFYTTSSYVASPIYTTIKTYTKDYVLYNQLEYDKLLDYYKNVNWTQLENSFKNEYQYIDNKIKEFQ